MQSGQQQAASSKPAIGAGGEFGNKRSGRVGERRASGDGAVRKRRPKRGSRAERHPSDARRAISLRASREQAAMGGRRPSRRPAAVGQDKQAVVV